MNQANALNEHEMDVYCLREELKAFESILKMS